MALPRSGSIEVIDWITLLAEAEGENFPFFEHEAYEFSKKTFFEDDNAGVYNDNPN